MGKPEALVKKAKKGDGEAFVSLVQRYEDVLYKVASRLLQKDKELRERLMKDFHKKAIVQLLIKGSE